MTSTESITYFFTTVKRLVLYAVVFLFPLFFLPTTQEFFATNKLYLLGFSTLFLVGISTIEFALTQRFVWVKGGFDSAVLLFLVASGLSVLLSSPNKVQALVSPHFGLVVVAALTILYFYISRIEKEKDETVSQPLQNIFLKLLATSASLVAIIAIVYFFNPLQSVKLPQALEFLKNPAFTTFGSPLDLAVFLGFFVVLSFTQLALQKKHGTDRQTLRHSAPDIFVLFVTALALCLTIYTMVKAQFLSSMPPFSISWYAAVETLKTPMTALFGVGVDNFASIFSRSKDVLYNQTSLWQVQSFNVSRSGLLHVFTETGLIGLLTFLLLVGGLLRELNQKKLQYEQKVIPCMAVLGYLLAVFLLLPINLLLLFLLFIVIASLNLFHNSSEVARMKATSEMDVRNLLPIYFSMIILALLAVGGASYLLVRSYAAEAMFKNALNGIAKDDMRTLYENQRQAIILNPYLEKYRISFSQTNLLIANNVATQVASQSASNQNQQPQLSEEQRQTISQAIQAAINEAKAAVALNQNKAGNWENLAAIYRNILFVAQGADVWTISSFQRAIVLDPQNPMYRLNLGGVYFSLQNYEEAAKMFEQAVLLKPDWPNAHYNLAWSSYQRGDYQRAVNEMQNVLSLIDMKKDKVDYDRAMKELEEFRKKLPKQEQSATESAVQSGQLALPTPPQAAVTPRLQLPQDASPETK